MTTLKERAEAYAAIASGVIDGTRKAAYLAGARAALEMAAQQQSSRAAKLRERLETESKRKHFDAARFVGGGRLMELPSNHVAELCEALRDEIAMHEGAASDIRALLPDDAREPERRG